MNSAAPTDLSHPQAAIDLPRVAFIGCGLMGGSLALALRQAGLVREICAFSPDEAELQWALAHGVITHAATSVEAAVQGAALIVLATPVGAMQGVFAELGRLFAQPSGRHVWPALITDLGSTKADVLAAAAAHLPAPLRSRFVGAHPIAGREVSGVRHARADLLDGARLILTPDDHTAPEALALATQLWTAVGCTTATMSAHEHDAAFGAVSHLPHLAAFALMHATLAQPRDWLEMAGSGFRDTTRVAASSPVMWRDIFLANRQHILAGSQQLRAQLAHFEAALAAQDAAAIERWITAASQARAACRFEP